MICLYLVMIRLGVPYWELVSYWNEVLYTVGTTMILAYFMLISAKLFSFWNTLAYGLAWCKCGMLSGNGGGLDCWYQWVFGDMALPPPLGLAWSVHCFGASDGSTESLDGLTVSTVSVTLYGRLIQFHIKLHKGYTSEPTRKREDSGEYPDTRSRE